MDVIISEAKFDGLDSNEIANRMVEMHDESDVAVIGVTQAIAQHLYNQGAKVTDHIEPKTRQRPGSIGNPLGADNWEYHLRYEGRRFSVTSGEKIPAFHE